MRHDIALQTAAERDRALASPSTLSRFENAANRDWAWRIHEAMVETFIASHSSPPTELILDFDVTDDAVHGKQEGRFFHGYYDHYCFLPLYVFCGDQLDTSKNPHFGRSRRQYRFCDPQIRPVFCGSRNGIS